MSLMAVPALANGLPVQIFLDHLPFKSTWTPASSARGVGVISANEELVRVMAQTLPSPPEGRVYYAWLEQVEGGFTPVGEMRYNADGTATIDQRMPNLPYSENFAWVLISLEEIGGIGSAPNVDIALAGRVPNQLALPPVGSELPTLLPVTGASKAELGGISPGSTLLWVVVLLALVGILAWGARHVRQEQRSRASLSIRHQDSRQDWGTQP
jgi:hypothetical protein